jgi:hypothetical protein
MPPTPHRHCPSMPPPRRALRCRRQREAYCTGAAAATPRTARAVRILRHRHRHRPHHGAERAAAAAAPGTALAHTRHQVAACQCNSRGTTSPRGSRTRCGHSSTRARKNLRKPCRRRRRHRPRRRAAYSAAAATLVAPSVRDMTPPRRCRRRHTAHCTRSTRCAVRCRAEVPPRAAPPLSPRHNGRRCPTYYGGRARRSGHFSRPAPPDAGALLADGMFFPPVFRSLFLTAFGA